MSRLRRQDGAISAEFVGILPLLLLVAVFGWQMLLFTSAGNSAAAAARNGARAVSTGESVHTVVERSLPSYLREHARVDRRGDGSVRVQVRVPILLRGLSVDDVTLSRSAVLPNTG